MSLILRRKSIREFTSEPILEEDITKMLTAAMQAPSAHNQQPWEFIVVQDEKIKEQLSIASKGAWMIKHAPLCIVVVMKKSDKSPLMRPQDCSAATENILLEAVNLNLGAVWIGVYPLEERYTYINKLLNITNETAFSMIAIGHPKNDKKVTIRYDESLVHHNKMK
jgi:nitroreductase